MKYKVLGVKRINYTSKKTNLPVKGVELHALYKDAEVYGTAVCPIFISENLGSDIVNSINPGDHVAIEYNQRGYVAGIEKVDAPATPTK